MMTSRRVRLDLVALVKRGLAIAAAAAAVWLATAGVALAQKQGGILRISHRDSPSTLSIHEEVTVSGEMPAMAMFNNLVMFKQDAPQNTLETIVPELATGWTWNEDMTRLTLPLRAGVRWHDGKPFSARDVKCTWDMLTEQSPIKFRFNPRKAWWHNLAQVATNGDFEVTFELKRPQPAFLALLASGYSPVYPCHVAPADMRRHPIGTGPFKFVEYKPNQDIKLARNPDYWRAGRPYLDGIEYTIIANRSTALLAFVTGKFDMTFPYDLQVRLMKDLQAQDPSAICELRPTNVSRNLIINRQAPPFDQAEIRHAMALTLDRQAFVDILTEGKGAIGGTLLPPPDGVWGLPADQLKALPAYDPDVAKRRAQARALMAKHGYGPDKPLKVKVTTRNIAQFRDPAVILIDQLKEIWIAGELDTVETANWYKMLARKDYAVGLNLSGSGLDEPDQHFYEHYACGSDRNVTGYCDPVLDRLVDAQSAEPDAAKRKALVWDIERKLIADEVKPMIFWGIGATCWKPKVRGVVTMANSIYNGWRLDDVWLADE
jgi:peptide/nickel transport system substrate-binding protein